jgi:curved DNA-binding protein CbpA
MNPDPFDALGLPARHDLTDEQVRAAWRAIAAGTHPDRADGGDVARYTAATAAFAELRTPWGRSEALADLAAASGDTSPLPLISTAEPWAAEPSVAGPWPAGPFSAGPATRPGLGGLRQLPARIWRGRRLRLVIRALAAAVLSWTALHLVPVQPAGPAAVTGLITWLLLTGRRDLAPPPGQ